jgi:actin-related protein
MIFFNALQKEMERKFFVLVERYTGSDTDNKHSLEDDIKIHQAAVETARKELQKKLDEDEANLKVESIMICVCPWRFSILNFAFAFSMFFSKCANAMRTMLTLSV